jgi:hypothetical protein
MVPLGIAGLFMARSDLQDGNTLIGVAQAAAGVVLGVYAFLAARVDVKRLANPTRLVIARDGFELSTGIGPVRWDEVETVSDPRSPEGDPKNLRIQLEDPQGFAARQTLSQFSRLMLRINRGDLILGSGMAKPVASVETLMRKQLAEFRHSESAGADSGSQVAASRTRPLKGRRPARKRQP